MKRRTLIKVLGLGGAGILVNKNNYLHASPETVADSSTKNFITVAHITDVHIREGDEAPSRFKKCLETILDKHQPDFFLNGGDSINDASYDNVVREQVLQQWKIWDDCIQTIKGYEIYSCIGNHDTWWKAPTTGDPMYGKPYVVERLNMPARYYSFNKGKWHFIILDGNNKNISLDAEQMQWLVSDLAALPAGQNVLVMGHYPILGTTQVLVGGGHADCKELKSLFYKYRRHVRICLSGHNHLQDKTVYNNVTYCCNGAMSGFWWGEGDKESAGKGYYLETPPGYAILRLYEDGKVENTYYAHEL